MSLRAENCVPLCGLTDEPLRAAGLRVLTTAYGTTPAAPAVPFVLDLPGGAGASEGPGRGHLGPASQGLG